MRRSKDNKDGEEGKGDGPNVARDVVDPLVVSHWGVFRFTPKQPGKMCGRIWRV